MKVAETGPMIEHILPDIPIPTLPVWLAAPQALKRTPRIRFVYDFLAREVTTLCIA